MVGEKSDIYIIVSIVILLQWERKMHYWSNGRRRVFQSFHKRKERKKENRAHTQREG